MMKQQATKQNLQNIQANQSGGQTVVGTPSSNASNSQQQKTQQGLQQNAAQQQQQVVNQQKFQDMKRIEDYTFCLSDLVGKGASGTVYLGENSVTKELVAIKVIDLHQVKDEYTWGLICSEIDIMKKLKCENVVKLIDVFQTQNNAYIITELCEDGDLVDFMKRNAGKIRQNQAVKIITDILRGLQELAKHGIIHRDLKPANILISKKDVFKITDFGFARMVEKNDYLMTSLVGTPLYMSPQILKRQMYTSKCDVWSIGLLFYELIYGQTPWPSNSVIDLVNNMFTNPLKFPNVGQAGDVILEDVKDFIKGCLKFEESDRLGWEDVYKHSLFKDVLYAYSQKSPNSNSMMQNNPFSNQDDRGSYLKSPNNQKDSQSNKKGSFVSSFQTSFMTTYTSSNTNTSKTAKGNNSSNNYSSKQQNNLYSNQKQAKSGTQSQKQQQTQQQNSANSNTNNQNINNATANTTAATTTNNNNNNTTLSSSTNSSNNNTQYSNQVQGIAGHNNINSNSNNNIQSILQKDFSQKTKSNSRQSTPSIQKQAINQVGQQNQVSNAVGAGVSDTKNQSNFENSQQSTPRQQSKLGNQYQTAAKLANINNGVIPQQGSFLMNSPANNNQQLVQQPNQSQQTSTFNVQNRQSQINSPHLKDKKGNGQSQITINQPTSSFLQQNIQSQSQNKLENLRQQYKKQVKDKKSCEYQYGQGSIHNLPNENQINNNLAPLSNNSGLVYGSINSNPSEKSNITAAATATSSTSSSSFNFIHKRQKSARDVIQNYNSASNNFYIPLSSPTKNQNQSDKYRILTEPNQINENKDSFSPNKNNTILGINRESNFQNSQSNQNQLPQSSSSPLSTEPSQNPVPTVLITLGSMNQILGGNSVNNGRVNSPNQTDQVSGNMLNMSNDNSQLEINCLYPNNQLNSQMQRVSQGVINLDQCGTPEKPVGLQLKQCFYQQKGYLKNNTRSITPTMSASAQKGLSSNTSNNTPKVNQQPDIGNNNNNLSNSKKALSNFNKFATFVYNTEERGSKLASNSNYISPNPHQNAAQSGKNSNNKRQKFNNRLSQQQQQQSQIQIMVNSKLSDTKQNLNLNNFNSSNAGQYQTFDPFKTADQVLINNFTIHDESLNSSGSPKNYDKSQQDNLVEQQQVLVAQNLNKPQHNYVQLNLNSANSNNNHFNFQSDKKINNSQSPTIKGSNQGYGKQNLLPNQYKSYDFSCQIQKVEDGIGSQNQGIQLNSVQSPLNQKKNSINLLPQVVQCRLDESSQNDNKNSDTNSERSAQNILNNPIINLNRRDITNQQQQQITQVNLNYTQNIKNILGNTPSQSSNSQYLGSPATNNSNIFSQLYNLEIGTQQMNSATNHIAVNLANPSSYQSPVMENKSVSSNSVSSQAMTPLDLKKTHSDFLSPQLKNNKFSFDSGSINITPQANTTTNQQNFQSIHGSSHFATHNNRQAQKSSDFNSFQSNFISSLVQQENYSSSDILNNYLNFCKLLSNIVRIINNSNFDKLAFQSSNHLLEKITFILLKNAMIKLTKVNDKMYANGENIFNLSDWNTFKISGKYTEMQTSFFLLFTEIQSSFESEWKKGNNHSTQSQQIAQDYSFVQLFNKDMNDDVRFYSISLSFVKSFIQLLNQKLSSNPQTSLLNPNPTFTDKNDIVAVTLLNDFVEYHEMLKTNLISMDTFHNQIFTKFNQFLSKFNNTYNYLTLVSKNYDAQFISNLQNKLKYIIP